MFVVYEEGGSEKHARGCDCGERVEEIRRTRLEYPTRGKRGGRLVEGRITMKRRINGAMMEAGGQTATALILNVWEVERAHWAGRPGGPGTVSLQ